MQGLLLLNFQSLDLEKSSSQLAKMTGITAKEITATMESILKAGIMIQNSSGKYQINQEFKPASEEVSLFSSSQDLSSMDSEALKSMDFLFKSNLNSEAQG